MPRLVQMSTSDVSVVCRHFNCWCYFLPTAAALLLAPIFKIQELGSGFLYSQWLKKKKTVERGTNNPQHITVKDTQQRWMFALWDGQQSAQCSCDSHRHTHRFVTISSVSIHGFFLFLCGFTPPPSEASLLMDAVLHLWDKSQLLQLWQRGVRFDYSVNISALHLNSTRSSSAWWAQTLKRSVSAFTGWDLRWISDICKLSMSSLFFSH